MGRENKLKNRPRTMFDFQRAERALQRAKKVPLWFAHQLESNASERGQSTGTQMTRQKPPRKLAGHENGKTGLLPSNNLTSMNLTSLILTSVDQQVGKPNTHNLRIPGAHPLHGDPRTARKSLRSDIGSSTNSPSHSPERCMVASIDASVNIDTSGAAHPRLRRA
jgi:hypothetical protein